MTNVLIIESVGIDDGGRDPMHCYYHEMLLYLMTCESFHISIGMAVCGKNTIKIKSNSTPPLTPSTTHSLSYSWILHCVYFAICLLVVFFSCFFLFLFSRHKSQGFFGTTRKTNRFLVVTYLNRNVNVSIAKWRLCVNYYLLHWLQSSKAFVDLYFFLSHFTHSDVRVCDSMRRPLGARLVYMFVCSCGGFYRWPTQLTHYFT